jgi:exonuclease SbcC
MKILRIRFQNLNSLCGIWDIDFTEPAYIEHNLFAITGPTGSGKTTLLDGICLALYGATPRLGKITKASNEIMSRHTGLCFAEVEFSTTKGTFRCHWSQHRSRQKCNGELQQPKHEIADAACGTILESRIRNVASKVEEVTGMDFDRFTRSTLLAQGGFAAFLQASANERAPILEQITGTEIYSQLSMKVHEFQGLEQQKLTDFEQSLAHINLLEPEVEEELSFAITETEKEGELCKTEIKSLQTQQVWFETMSRLIDEKNVCLQKLDLLNKEKEAHQDELDTLQPALAAKPIEPLYKELENLLECEKNTLKECSTLEKKHCDLENTLKATNTQSETTGKGIVQTEKTRETGLLLIRNVQILDHTILAEKNNLQEQIAELSAKRSAHQKEDTAINALKQNLLKKLKSQKLLEKFFQERACDSQLIEEFGAIQLQLTTLGNLHEQHRTIAKTQETVTKKKQKSKQTVKQLARDTKKLQQEGITTKNNLDQLQKSINQLLKGKEAASIHQTLFQIRNRQKSLQELLQVLDELEPQTKKLEILLKEAVELSKQEIELAAKHQLSETKQDSKQKEIDLLERNLRLLTQIQNLEAERNKLQDNAPCPLCGSTHHPYNHGNVPEISKEENLLQNAKIKLTNITEECTQLAREGIISVEKQKNHSIQAKDTKEQISRSEKKVQQLLLDLDFPPLAKTNRKQLDNEYQKLITEQQQLETDCDHLEKQNKKLHLAAANRDKLLTSMQQLEHTLLEANHNAASIDQEEYTLSEQAAKISAELVVLNTDLLMKTEGYGIRTISTENLPFILKELNQRVRAWKENKEKEKHISPQIISLTSELNHKETLQAQLTKQIQEDGEKCQIIQKKNAESVKERIQLFGEKETIPESERLEQNVKNARTKYDLLQKECVDIEKKVTASQTLLNRLQSESNSRKLTIINQKHLFQQAILTSAFSDSQEFLDARLPDSELDTLQKLYDKLQRKKTELQALLKDKELTLQLEKEKQLCSIPVEELNRELEKLENQYLALQEKIITAKEQLKTNNTNKNNIKEQLTAIEFQKKIAGRWNRLHMLIGSADGKKFRNFAQGLTFEMMVLHANKHLQKMNDRYILIRDHTHPLDLNVMDMYQADEIRSTKNLSGGESFLVSLALALGLSKMASQNVRIDSLFLDEGFGTLDEDALESALETLAGLRDENKLIGIISHVTALKERIPLQITIIQGNRGRSSIIGPGVTMEQG